jgi:hypothetical protein
MHSRFVAIWNEAFKWGFFAIACFCGRPFFARSRIEKQWGTSDGLRGLTRRRNSY